MDIIVIFIISNDASNGRYVDMKVGVSMKISIFFICYDMDAVTTNGHLSKFQSG